MSEKLKWKGPLSVKEPAYDPIWTLETKLWKAAIYKDWGYYYIIKLNVEGLDKEVASSFTLREHNKPVMKSLEKIKAAIESTFALLDKANTPGNSWIAKIVTMGGISEDDFQYFSVEGQPK